MGNLSSISNTKVKKGVKSREDVRDAKKLKIWKETIVVNLKVLSQFLYRDREEMQPGLQVNKPYSSRAISEYYQPPSFAEYTCM